ncbi:uncharacterized protein LOC135343300 isoform X2 [Halichondria panicea]|uniref:uncharacterized protein LOC135343300 isoform X2 n=1 Tax=Halichondria panicea TaxID=6063 RepID=UPI00312B845C
MAELEKFLKLVDSLQTKLQQYTAIKLSWSWICLKLLKLLSNYPSGVTKAIILSELHNEAEKTGGKLTTHSHSCTSCAVGDILESKSVAYESVLETAVSTVYTVPNTTTKVIQLGSEGKGHLEMYLHKKFYHILDVLTTHTLRLTCCRLVSRTSPKSKLHLLPTEHLAVLLTPSEETEFKQSGRFLSLSDATADIHEQTYCENLFANVVDIGKEDVITTSDGNVFRRMTLQLSNDEGTSSTPLVLWDTYTSLTRLLSQGDTLFIERPYAKPSSSGQCCLEYAPGTIIYLAPYRPQEEIVPSQYPSDRAPVLVVKTDQVMLLEITSFKDTCQDVTVHAKDSTGTTLISVRGVSIDKLTNCQWAVMSGLVSVVGDSCSLSLCCDLYKGGKLFNVEGMQGWQASQ